MSERTQARAVAPEHSSSFTGVQGRLSGDNHRFFSIRGLCEHESNPLVFPPLFIQRKLAIGKPHDKYEEEADRMADMVMRMPEPAARGTPSWPFRQGLVCGEEEAALQAKPTVQQRIGSNPAGHKDVPSIVHEVLHAPGRPLDSSTRGIMEPRFGHDFRQVRVHTDARAAHSAWMVNALAYTVGDNVVFGRDQYAPETPAGQRLLVHELAHVVQQMEGSPGEQVYREQPGGFVTTEEFDIAQYQEEHHRLIDNWRTRNLANMQTNATNARNASRRFIEFEEGGISQLRTTGTVSTGVAYLFGTPGAVVALCLIVLTEVVAQGLSGRSQKIAAAVARLDTRHQRAIREINQRHQRWSDRIDSTMSLDWSGWTPLWNELANAGVPEVVPENIIYRDLLLELARGGGYNISGSQWNVENMSVFGNAPWYHSWDWGSPGWTNGQDIADELNDLAAGDPTTRTTVRINPP